MKEKAFFIFRPRTVEDLILNNPDGRFREYQIVKTICLNMVDYDNFAYDMLADRQFIEDNFKLCVEKGDCLLITNKNRVVELLVIPWRDRFVRYAALRPKIHIL